MKTRSLIALIAPALCTLPAAAQFSVQYLGSFGPAVTFRMNNSGQIAGDKQINSLTTAIRFTPGVGIEARSTPKGSGLSYAVGLNNAGVCIGQIDPLVGPEAGAIWDVNNVLTMLPIPAGQWTYNTGTDINDSNIACGFVTEAIVGDDPQASWRWDAVNSYTMLPQLNGGNYSFARDINAVGVICGYAGPAESGPMHAVVWDAANQIIDLGLVGTASETFAQAINDAGVVVGTSDNGTPWKYVPGTGMVALPKFGNQPAGAYGVNNAGWVVGYAQQSGEPRTVVWDPNGVIYKIEDYVVGNFYFPADGSYPIAINDNNDLVVYAYDFDHACCDPLAVRFHFGYPAPCVADLNGDDTVGVADLLSVITSWGACVDVNNCPADISPAGGDDAVGVADLLAVITAWGTCP